MEDAAWAHAALVQEIFGAADGAYVGRWLASALGADRLIAAGVPAKSPQLPATRAVRLRCKGTCVAPFADRAFMPVSHGLSRLTAVCARLRRDRAANDAEHLALALAAARSDTPTALALHHWTLPADAAQIRISIASEPHDRAHAATSTTCSNWPLVAGWAPRLTVTIAPNGEGTARPARCRLDRAAAGAQRRFVLANRQRRVQVACRTRGGRPISAVGAHRTARLVRSAGLVDTADAAPQKRRHVTAATDGDATLRRDRLYLTPAAAARAPGTRVAGTTPLADGEAVGLAGAHQLRPAAACTRFSSTQHVALRTHPATVNCHWEGPVSVAIHTARPRHREASGCEVIKKAGRYWRAVGADRAKIGRLLARGAISQAAVVLRCSARPSTRPPQPPRSSTWVRT